MPSLADTALNETNPVNELVANPCNGEVVFLQGTIHTTMRVTTDKDGGAHLGIHQNLNITGTGGQGNTYVSNAAANDTMNGKVGSEETNAESFVVISQGSAPNFVLTEVSHLTVNPDGTVTASFDHFTAECHG